MVLETSNNNGVVQLDSEKQFSATNASFPNHSPNPGNRRVLPKRFERLKNSRARRAREADEVVAIEFIIALESF